MPDKVQQTFVRSFIGYLKKQVDPQTLTPDAQESVEVAVQCLQAAFDVSEGEDEQPQVDTPAESGGNSTADSSVDAKEIDLFELFQSLYIERNPQSLEMAESIKNEGNRLMKDGKYNEALLQYNRAITFDPKNPIFYCNRAAAYIRLGDNERAITDCKSALLYNPSYSKAYSRLGMAYSNLGKYGEAQIAIAKAIELEPDNQDYRNNFEVARNAQMRPNLPPSFTEGMNMVFTNPAVINMLRNANIDLENVRNMSQDPVVMNSIGEVLTGLQGRGGAQPSSNDFMQFFQTQLSNNTQGGGGGSGSEPQQPPSS